MTDGHKSPAPRKSPAPKAAPPPKKPAIEAEILIESLIAGGRGLGRLEDGRVIFVPRALPGDKARVRLTKSKRRFAEGIVVERLEDSPHRVTPPCDIAHLCGGCPWMSLDYPAQLKAKGHIVTEALARIGKVPREHVAPIRPAKAPLAYRTRARLIAQGDTIGFRGLGENTPVDVVTCAILEAPLDDALAKLRFALKPHMPLEHPLQVELLHHGEGKVSIAVSGRQAEVLKSMKTGENVDLHLYPMPLRPTPLRHLPFAQANREGNEALRAQVHKALNLSPSQSLLDIYCGSGNFSIPLAKAGVSVFGIEVREDAIQRAKARLGGDDRATFVAGDANTWMKRLATEGRHFDGAILNPPRSGAGDTLKSLIALGPETLVYVSCDPATLARDLATLQEAYTLESAQPYDLMPHTFHVETVAILKRRS